MACAEHFCKIFPFNGQTNNILFCKILTGIDFRVLAQKLQTTKQMPQRTKPHKMKAIFTLFVTCLFITVSMQLKAQPRKVIYNENEITLPNYLKFHAADDNVNSIQGKLTDKAIFISWQTATETNTSHFELQRSYNGNDFEPIETITAGRITSDIRSYTTNDDKEYNAADGNVYYRIKTVFTNGKENFTTAIVINGN